MTGMPAGTAHGAPGAVGSAAQWLPTGASITPLAVPGTQMQPLNPGLKEFPEFLADHAVAEALTPDGATLLVLTSGFNRNFDERGNAIAAASNDYVFVFDVSSVAPRQMQALALPNAFLGLAVAPDARHFFVAGGSDDDIHVFVKESADGAWREDGPAVQLGHPFGVGLAPVRAAAAPAAAGLAVSADGGQLVVADFGNDAATVVDWARRSVVAELDLRPGKIDPARAGARGGTYPYGVALRGSDTAYISSMRDREIVIVRLKPAPRVTSRIALSGNPNQLILNRDGTRLYVAEDNTDRIAVIDTATNRLVRELPLRMAAQGARLPARGLSPDALALSGDERTLYVAMGGINALAVLELPTGVLRGLIPTGWYPTAVALSRHAGLLYIVNGKSPEGPNPRNCVRQHVPPAAAARCEADRPAKAANDYVLQLSKAALAAVPVPDPSLLASLTRTVLGNNRISAPADAGEGALFRVLRRRIHHVIYIVKENRTYDQILGDLPVGNGDPALAQFPRELTPNQHALATQFVDLDSFYDSGEVSGTGWPWSVAGRTSEVVEKTVPPYYAHRGFSYDSEGTNREVNVALATPAQRMAANPLMQADPDVLAGSSDVAAPDGDGDEIGNRERGNLWDAALRRHLTVRNYGFFIDLTRYAAAIPAGAQLPLDRDPAASRTVVAYSTNPSLAPHTDPYFRGFDNRFADFYRYREWAREFAAFERDGNLPRLELVRFMHDHFGDFGSAADAVNTPERQVADNDYAVGLLIERVAHSRYAKDTLIFIVEDDAQDGPDHVDAHRSIAFIAGPFVRRTAVISTRYTTVDLVRTMELVMGLHPLNVHDALARPMTDVFDLDAVDWRYDAIVPEVLRSTRLPLPERAPAAAHESGAGRCAPRERDPPYWAEATRDLDFSAEDRVDAERFNRVIWAGQRGEAAYPALRSGANLRAGREALLAAWARSCAPLP